jgi:hypothetical protein
MVQHPALYRPVNAVEGKSSNNYVFYSLAGPVGQTITGLI